MNTQPMIKTPRELGFHQRLRFYTPLAMLFVALFVTVNIITQKIVPLGDYLIITAGDFIYPLNYLLSMVLTEVYGYAMSRRVIWAAFGCNILVAMIITFAIALPVAPVWSHQSSYAIILGQAPRLLTASFGAFLIGEFMGTYILAKTKVFTAGRYLWLRTIGGTLVGQLVDSIIFTTVAFLGIVGLREVMILSIAAYGCKIIYQVLLTPAIYLAADFLKRQERVDIFDRHTNFNPFNLGLK